MVKMKRVKIDLIKILIIALFLLNESIIVQSDNSFQNGIYESNYLYTKIDFTDFNIKEEKIDIHSVVTPEEILIMHNDSVSSSSQQIFVVEYNIGRANFSDFDISLDISYDVSLPIYWGDLQVIIGSDYQPDYFLPIDRKLCFTQIKDPWGGADGVFIVGTYVDTFPDEFQITAPDLATPDSVTFHLNRTGETVCCEILKDSTSLLSISWTQDLTFVCNYIRIQLDYYSGVEEFSFTLSNFNAVLDVLGVIDEPTSIGFSFNIPSIRIVAVMVIVSIISVLSSLKRKKSQ